AGLQFAARLSLLNVVLTATYIAATTGRLDGTTCATGSATKVHVVGGAAARWYAAVPLPTGSADGHEEPSKPHFTQPDDRGARDCFVNDGRHCPGRQHHFH